MEVENGSLRQSIAICKIAGCQFSDETMKDLEKVERGEMTMADIIKKLNKKLARLKKEKPEYFAVKGIENHEKQ